MTEKRKIIYPDASQGYTMNPIEAHILERDDQGNEVDIDVTGQPIHVPPRVPHPDND